MRGGIVPSKTIEHLLIDGAWFWQLLRYGFIGVSSNITFYVIANLSFLFTASALVSAVIGWAFSYVVSLLGHGIFTYKSVIRRAIVVKFSILACINLSMIQILILLGDQVFAWPYWMSSLVVVLIVPVFSFFAGRYLVFLPNSRPTRRACRT